MKLGVVVLNWNGKDITPRCLDSLLRSSRAPDQIVVVDNASTDGSADLVRGQYPQVVLTVNDSNLGFAEGNNVGIRYLLEREFDLILLLNNDAMVDPECLGELMRAAMTHPAAAYGATVYELARPERVWYAGGAISPMTLDARSVTGPVDSRGSPRATDFVTGCCMLFRGEALKKVGLLDKDFFAYYEDVDWCLRAKAASEGLVYVPSAAVHHDVSHSFRRAGATDTRRGRHSWSQSRPLVLYLAYRNRLLLARRHARGTLHRAFLVLRRFVRAGLHAGILGLSGRVAQAAAVLEGTIDGMKGAAEPTRLQKYLSAVALPTA